MAVSEKLLALLVCPKCKGKLEHSAPDSKEPSLDCRACKKRYMIENEIPVLLVSEAKPLD